MRIALTILLLASTTLAQSDRTLQQIADTHPAAETLSRLLSNRDVHFTPTNLTRADYLTLIAGNVDFFKQHQDAKGAVIDPYEKFERQYATPAFALDAAILVRDLNRTDLLEPATRAMTFALAALVNHTTADNHPDFYIPLLMHARRILKDHAPKEMLESWDKQFRSLVPEKTYKDTGASNNWNIVNLSGESLRRVDGLVVEDQLAPQQSYLDKSLKLQLAHFTPAGMFADPNFPLAYDAFPRLWLEDMMFDRAYAGEHLAKLRENLALGGLSSLLLFSPQGEWASGGRSAQHQWNEAEIAVIAEINAVKWNATGRDDLAGMFKRMAHLALTSIRRWQRPSGELWIVKNRADPTLRFGYEGYSFHSQYNLLAMAMLAIAHERADDTIAERPISSEYGSYVFDLRDPFHKIVAAAGGTYILIDTAADPKFNATGLQRIHKAGVEYSPLSDSAARERSYGPGDAPKADIAPGVQSERPGPCTIGSIETSPDSARFTLNYGTIEERWQVTADGAECASRFVGDQIPANARFVFPVLVSDGAEPTKTVIADNKLSIDHRGGHLTLEILAPSNTKLTLQGPEIPTHNGLVQSAAASISTGSQVRWRVQLSATK